MMTFLLLQQVQIERKPDANAPRDFLLTPGDNQGDQIGRIFA
jgi:hypothetical protein